MPPTRSPSRSPSRRKSTVPWRWVGKPVRRDPATGDVYYHGFRMTTGMFHVGEMVWLPRTDGGFGSEEEVDVGSERNKRPTRRRKRSRRRRGANDTEEEKQEEEKRMAVLRRRRVGRIMCAWENKQGTAWVEVCRYYWPEETCTGRRPSHGTREIFASSLCEEVEVSRLLGPCSVMTYEAWIRRRTEGTASDEEESDEEGREEMGILFCRLHYNATTGEFRPLVEDFAMMGDPLVDLPRRPRRIACQRTSVRSRPTPSDAGISFDRALEELKQEAVPLTLPCREQERSEVMSFLDGAIRRGGSGACLYISGLPGTGKTATVHEVVRSLQREAEEARLPTFQFVELNGMKMTTPQQAYSYLLRALTGENTSPAQAVQQLERRFNSKTSKHPCCVLLLDELDFLVTRKQMVLYNLFDWPSRPFARLVVVGIANTMDLPERLIPRVYSRIGLSRVTFAPYTPTQLETIIASRLSDIQAFESDAVELCARKIAAVSGDVRRALEICRRAAEIASGKDASAPRITMDHVDRASQELCTSSSVIAIHQSPLHDRYFLIAFMVERRLAGMEEVTFELVAKRHADLIRTQALPVPTTTDQAAICTRLVTCRLLLAEGTKPLDRFQRLRLNVLPDDVTFALRDDKVAQRLL